MADGSDRASADGRVDGPSAFHERVLLRLPTAVIVVDRIGDVVFANESALRLIDWPLDDVLAANALDLIHPDDREVLIEAFAQLATASSTDQAPVDRPWAPINFRFARGGEAVPVELTGRGLLHDPDVGGIVYEIRPAHEWDILQRVVAGVASGGGLLAQFDLVLDLISASTLEINSAVVFTTDPAVFGPVEVVRASDSELFDVLDLAAQAGELSVFDVPAPTPRFVDVADIEGRLGDSLAAMGFRDAWHIDVTEQLGGVRYAIIGLTREHHVPAMGVRERLTRAADLASVIVLRIRSQRLLEQAAHHDSLTGLPNRVGLQRDVDARRAQDADLRLLFIDLDRFKPVNDEHGHLVGDDVLRIVARRLSASTSPDDLVARIGGDEFAVVISADGLVIDDIRIAQRLIDAVSAPIRTDAGLHHLSASIGLVTVPPGVDLDTALDRADQAMYVAKRAGGGRVHREADEPLR